MTTPTLLLLDLDGVFSINSFKPLPGVEKHYPDPNTLHPTAYPVPTAWQLLRWLHDQPHIHPRWLSSWGVFAHFWNEWAGIPEWKVIYPLDNYGLNRTDWQALKTLRESRLEAFATKQDELSDTDHWQAWHRTIAASLPDAQSPLKEQIDRLLLQPEFELKPSEYARETKLMAAMVEMENWQGRVVWVEDGGWDGIERAWAVKHGVILFDTCKRNPAGLWQGLEETLKTLLLT